MKDFFILMTIDELDLVLMTLESRKYECETDSKEYARIMKLQAYLESQRNAETKK